VHEGSHACAALLLVGCHYFGSCEADAPPPVRSCRWAVVSARRHGSANLTVHVGAGITSYDRVYAGGIWLTGPVTGPHASGAPFALLLVFAQTSPIPGEVGVCCGNGAQTVRNRSTRSTRRSTTSPTAAKSGARGQGAEQPGHTVHGDRHADDPDFLHLPASPGRIAGSLSVVTNTIVDGTFDNQFCGAMLTATI
jgi:hypothetical protein